MNNVIFIILIGIGATAVLDLWSLLRKYLFNIPPTNWGMVGRWIAYIGQGQFRHDAIAESKSIGGEHFIGWTAHYLIGISYALILVLIGGQKWGQHPSLGIALAVGVATVVAPFFILQPGMGAGVAASRTPKPNAVRLQSVINHAVFGYGLYLSALVVTFVKTL